jgi:hypothetical protein
MEVLIAVERCRHATLGVLGRLEEKCQHLLTGATARIQARI